MTSLEGTKTESMDEQMMAHVMWWAGLMLPRQRLLTFRHMASGASGARSGSPQN